MDVAYKSKDLLLQKNEYFLCKENVEVIIYVKEHGLYKDFLKNGKDFSIKLKETEILSLDSLSYYMKSFGVLNNWIIKSIKKDD